jgi:hypothetical protein
MTSIKGKKGGEIDFLNVSSVGTAFAIKRAALWCPIGLEAVVRRTIVNVRKGPSMTPDRTCGAKISRIAQ